MKMNEQMIENARKWVEKNGLHPQPCGATVASFCEAMGITDRTYYNWCKNSAFSDALLHAREVFHTNTVREVENALVKAARGVDFVHIKEEKKAQKVKEYDEKGRKVKEYDGNPVIVKSVRETIYYPPNVEAAKFVLANMAGDKWRIKQEQTINAGEGVHIHVDSADEKDKIEKIGDIG